MSLYIEDGSLRKVTSINTVYRMFHLITFSLYKNPGMWQNIIALSKK